MGAAYEPSSCSRGTILCLCGANNEVDWGASSQSVRSSRRCVNGCLRLWCFARPRSPRPTAPPANTRQPAQPYGQDFILASTVAMAGAIMGPNSRATILMGKAQGITSLIPWPVLQAPNPLLSWGGLSRPTGGSAVASLVTTGKLDGPSLPGSNWTFRNLGSTVMIR